MNFSLGFPEFSQDLTVGRRPRPGRRAGALPDPHRSAKNRPSAPSATSRPRKASSATCPKACIPSCCDMLWTRRGIARLYSHQAEAFEHVAAGPQRGGGHAHRQRQDALLQPARAEPAAGRPRRARHVPVPHQGAGRGPAARVAQRGGGDGLGDPRLHLRRRHAAGRAQGHPRSAPTSCSPIRTCCTPASCRTTPAGRSCFENLRYIVIDELHYYRGVYGSHLANVLRRLKRICEFYGSKPQFICCSATIANPRELAEAADRRAFRAGGPQRRAARREVLRLLQSAGGEPAARHPPQLHQRDAAHGDGVHRARPADAGLRQQPAGHRGAGHLPEGRLRARPAAGGDACAATAAATCRASAARSSAGCARARSAPWWRPTRSSSASTSARSTRW